MRNGTDNHACFICGRTRKKSDLVVGGLVGPSVAARIEASRPGWSHDSVVCHECLRRLRAEYVQSILETERGELSELETDVLRSLSAHEVLSRDVNAQFDRGLSLGDR